MSRRTRTLRRVAVLVSALVVSVGGMLVSSGTASADPLDGPTFWSKCTTDMHWPGDKGVINAQLAPSGSIQWNIVDYVDNHGKWLGDVWVGKRRVDHKDQDYNPHGSVSAKDARSGLLFRITMVHTDLEGNVSHSAPNAGWIIP